jgi:hypothetical protein
MPELLVSMQNGAAEWVTGSSSEYGSLVAVLGRF